MRRIGVLAFLACAALLAWASSSIAQPEATSYRWMKSFLDSVPAVDTHDHLWNFDELPGWRQGPDGEKVMNLASIWQNSYLNWFVKLPAWPRDGDFREWWRQARPVFDDARAMSVYRYTLPALQDLYGVDFEALDDQEAARLNERITANYRDQRWLYKVITEKANIELVLNDPYWDPFDFSAHYAFAANVLRLNPLFRGFHPSEFASSTRPENPYDFAKAQGVDIQTFDDYLAFIDRTFLLAKQAGLVGLKHTLAYERTLLFERTPKELAAEAFGKERQDLTAGQVKAFEDFLMWHLTELSAKYALPFQIHTGYPAPPQRSSPALLTDLIAANPNTVFVLFHGGFPSVGEAGAVAARFPNVYLDSVWLPTLSQETARRAFHEWLDLIPSNRIMWGGDCNHPEGIYGAAETTRRVLAQVLSERLDRDDLRRDDARRIGRQILRENALTVFPGLKEKLWKHKQEKLAPPE